MKEKRKDKEWDWNRRREKVKEVREENRIKQKEREENRTKEKDREEIRTKEKKREVSDEWKSGLLERRKNEDRWQASRIKKQLLDKTTVTRWQVEGLLDETSDKRGLPNRVLKNRQKGEERREMR